MKKDNKERTLSEAERRRLERFEQITRRMEQQGYVRRDLTISIGKANVFAILLLIPLLVIGFGLYYAVHQRLDYSGSNLILFFVVFIVLIAVHELIHGVCWSIFTPHHFRDIEFGIIKSSLTPYCTCLEPLKRGQHIFGTVMPLVILGILPMAAGIALGRTDVLFMGIIMADSAAGDIMVIRRFLGYRSDAAETVFMDHPTQAGGVVFEKQGSSAGPG